MSETRAYNLRNPRVKEAANPEVARMEDEHNYTHHPPIADEQQSEVGGGFSLPNVEDDKDRPNVSIPTTVEALSQSARPKARLNTTVTYSHDWTREHAGANTDIRFDAGDAVTSLALPNLMTTRPLLTRSTSSIQPDVSGDAPGIRHLMTDVTSKQTLVGTPLISSEPKLRIPTYDGKQDFESFWVQFKFISNQFHWDEEKTLMHLVSSLRDAALTYVSRLPIRSQCDLTEMVACLKRRFGDNVLPETHRASLENMKKDSRESLPEYATRVREIMSKAYPGLEGTELYTKLLIEHVVKGLPDASIVYDVFTKKPQTLETALDLIEWHECCKTMKKKSANVRRLTDEREFEVRHVGNNESGNPVTEERLNLICADLKSELADTLHEIKTMVSRRETARHIPMVSRGETARRNPMVSGGETARRNPMVSGGETARRNPMVSGGETARRNPMVSGGETARRNPMVSGGETARHNPMVSGGETTRHNKFTGECYACHEFGHRARDCARVSYRPQGAVPKMNTLN